MSDPARQRPGLQAHAPPRKWDGQRGSNDTAAQTEAVAAPWALAVTLGNMTDLRTRVLRRRLCRPLQARAIRGGCDTQLGSEVPPR